MGKQDTDTTRIYVEFGDQIQEILTAMEVLGVKWRPDVVRQAVHYFYVNEIVPKLEPQLQDTPQS